MKALKHTRGRRTKYTILQGENIRQNYDTGQVASIFLLIVNPTTIRLPISLMFMPLLWGHWAWAEQVLGPRCDES